MGLDPPTRKLLSLLLNQLAEARAPRILLSLRPQDTIPNWMTHLICITEDFKVSAQGPKADVLNQLHDSPVALQNKPLPSDNGTRMQFREFDATRGQPLIEMQGVQVKYGERCALGDWQQEIDGEQKAGLWWTVRQGQRWGIFGANGRYSSLTNEVASDLEAG